MPYGAEASVRSARPSHPPYDRGRQRSERPVRLPQPKGAGGQQPPKVAERPGLHAAPGRNGPKLPRLTAVLPARWPPATRIAGPTLRDPTAYEGAGPCRRARTGGSPQPKGRERETAYLGAPAGK